MLTEYLAPFDVTACSALMRRLHGRGFSIIDTEQVLFVFRSATEAVLARLSLGDFASPVGVESYGDETFRLCDDPRLVEAIDDLKNRLDLNVWMARIILVDVGETDWIEADESVKASHRVSAATGAP